jgi:UDP-N-acetylglucosamine acyltransferase
MADGRPAYPHGLNKVGLKRRGFTLEQRTRLKQAYKILWFSGLSMSTAIARVREAIPADPHVDELLTFIETSKRGIKQPPRKAGHPAESNGETAELTLI